MGAQILTSSETDTNMESIEEFVLEQLAAWEVPGCAIAAVQDGYVVLAAEFELDDSGAVARLVAQPLGIFVPKT